MIRYWIAVACKEHVQKGISEGFAQACHGKANPLNRMNENDWIIYYSPTIAFGKKDPCQSFTAIGTIKKDSPYLFPMSETFTPWRRDVDFLPSKEAPIRSLIPHLSFIKDKMRWGFPFRSGFFEVEQKDFHIIAKAMDIDAL